MEIGSRLTPQARRNESDGLTEANSSLRARPALLKVLNRVARRFAWPLVSANALVLMAASWAPADAMIRTQELSGKAEHAIAYFASGAAMAFLLGSQWAPWQVASGLALYAAILEVGQIFVPGRNAAVTDFLVSAAAGTAGAALCWLISASDRRRS